MSAEMTAGEDAPDRPARGPGRKRSVIVFGAILLVLIAATAWLFVLRPSGSNNAAKLKAQAASASGAATVVEIPEFVANLDAGPHRVSFAKVQIGIEVERTADAAAVRTAMPRIVDMAETYVRTVRPEELRSDTGAYLLREALLSRMMIVAPAAHVSQILFEELLVQ